jgi:hypothetical protein
MPMASAAIDPAVPGAFGAYPHPNHVDRRLASLTDMDDFSRGSIGPQMNADGRR